jgi:hypothetical protein
MFRSVLISAQDQTTAHAGAARAGAAQAQAVRLAATPVAKRKRTPDPLAIAPAAAAAGEQAAYQAFAEVTQTCCRALAAPGALYSQATNLFWALPYELQRSEPQIVVAVERYVLPNRSLRHTVFNDTGFLARIIHQQTTLQPVHEGDEDSSGLVLVKPNCAEGFLRLVWPAELLGPTLDELFRRSSPCTSACDQAAAESSREDEVCHRLTVLPLSPRIITGRCDRNDTSHCHAWGRSCANGCAMRYHCTAILVRRPTCRMAQPRSPWTYPHDICTGRKTSPCKSRRAEKLLFSVCLNNCPQCVFIQTGISCPSPPQVWTFVTLNTHVKTQ